jgi:hypothetical protein
VVELARELLLQELPPPPTTDAAPAARPAPHLGRDGAYAAKATVDLSAPFLQSRQREQLGGSGAVVRQEVDRPDTDPRAVPTARARGRLRATAGSSTSSDSSASATDSEGEDGRTTRAVVANDGDDDDDHDDDTDDVAVHKRAPAERARPARVRKRLSHADAAPPDIAAEHREVGPRTAPSSPAALVYLSLMGRGSGTMWASCTVQS